MPGPGLSLRRVVVVGLHPALHGAGTMLFAWGCTRFLSLGPPTPG